MRDDNRESARREKLMQEALARLQAARFYPEKPKANRLKYRAISYCLRTRTITIDGEGPWPAKGLDEFISLLTARYPRA